MRRSTLAAARSTRLLSIAALLAAPLVGGCTSHRSIFDSDGGVVGDGGTSDGGSDGGTLGTPVSISITGVTAAPMQIGTTATLHVVATDASGNQGDVTSEATLTSSNTGVASLSGNVLTAIARGTSVIRASLLAGTQALQANATVTVDNAAAGMTTAVQVAPATLSLAPGLGSQLAANATQGDGSQLSVTTQAHWTSSDTSLCTVDDDLEKGFVTAVAVGTCTVTAAYGGKSGTATVSIQQLSVTALTLSPATAQVAAGGTAQLTAAATLSDGSIADATHSAVWSTSDSSKATVQNGLVTGAAVGSATITATLGAISATAQITISAATLSSISVAPPQTVIAAGLTQQFTATAVYSDGTSTDVTATATWSSDTPAIAAIDTTTPGLVDALAVGRANVSATLNSVAGSALVTVTDATPTRINLLPSPLTVPAGVSQQVTALALFSDNSLRDISSDAIWTIGNAGFATVSAGGLVTGIAAGSTQLTATLGGISATDAVTVTAAQLAQILLLPQNSSVNIGGTQQITATGIYGDNSLHDVTEQATWSTSAVATATVSNSAGTRGLTTGVAAGTAQITATIGGVTSSPASVTVSAATLVSIAMTPAQVLTAVYITVPTHVTARYSDGSELDVTAQAVYSSASTAIASVVAAGADAGEVTGVGQGQTTISATFGGQSASVHATVVAATLQSITIAQPRGTIEVGQSVALTAQAQFQGAPVGVDVTALVTWTSSDQTVGVFVQNPNGLFTAQGAGTATVAAELDGVSGTRAITVSGTTPVSIAVLQATFTLPVGVTHALVATGTYADGTTQDLTYGATWASDANSIAVVGDTGVLKGLVTGVAAGTAHITATLGGITGTATATVDAANATSISVTPLDPVVSVSAGGGGGGMGGGGGGARTQKVFYATATFDDGSSQDVTQSCIWTSSNPSVATISDEAGTKGVATVLAAGGTTITASFRGLTNSTSLTAQ